MIRTCHACYRHGVTLYFVQVTQNMIRIGTVCNRHGVTLYFVQVTPNMIKDSSFLYGVTLYFIQVTPNIIRTGHAWVKPAKGIIDTRCQF